jgi:hypothetical protein
MPVRSMTNASLLVPVILMAFAARLYSTGATAPALAGGQAPKCEASPLFRAEPPQDVNADRFGEGPWYINTDRTIWAGWDAGRWHAGRNKVLWIRPAGTRLRVEGERVDRAAPPLVANIPNGYSTGFQASALFFPTEGCWRVHATSGEHELTFVTNVGLGPASRR